MGNEFPKVRAKAHTMGQLLGGAPAHFIH